MGNPLFLAASGNQTQNLSIFDPASPGAESIRQLAILVLAICGFIFLVVEGVLLYCILRFRHRSAEAGEPPQVYGSKALEIAWTAAPAIIVTILVMVTARTLWEVNIDPPRPKPGDNALYVTVVGRQWWWEYTYDHYNGERLGFTTANELHVPASADGTPRRIHLTLQSADVCHSFWVPRLGGKTDLIPGRTNHATFETAQTGPFLGQCAEFCGTQHANMLLRVVVDSPDAFEDWLKHEQQPVADDPALYAARKTFLAESCVDCHRVRGTTANGSFAPDLTHLMSRKTLAAGIIENDREGKNLRRWVYDPQALKPGCLMAAFPLKDTGRDDIFRFLLSLR